MEEDLVAAIVAEGIRDPRLLAAVRAVPRADFVPPELQARASVDEPLWGCWEDWLCLRQRTGTFKRQRWRQ